MVPKWQPWLKDQHLVKAKKVQRLKDLRQEVPLLKQLVLHQLEVSWDRWDEVVDLHQGLPLLI